jgi:hypothetical protein
MTWSVTNTRNSRGERKPKEQQMNTLGTLIETTGVDVDSHLDRDELVPVLSGLQIQGDVAVIPTRPSAKQGTPVSHEGVPVVRGENGGHTHLLLGDVSWAPVDEAGQTLGVVTVPSGGTGYLAHPEHGFLAFGAGCYSVRRQREQADAIRLVRD